MSGLYREIGSLKIFSNKIWKTLRGNQREHNMDKNTLGYLAGVIDGEGYIGLEKTQPNQKVRQINPRYMPNVCVINIQLELINWLKKQWGGSVNTRNRNMKRWKSNWRTCYRWRLNQGRIVEFLTAIRPYMIVKRRQADLMIEYYQKRTKSITGIFNGRHGSKSFSPEEMEFRETIYKQMKNLNHYDPQRLNEKTPERGDAIVRPCEKSQEAST